VLPGPHLDRFAPGVLDVLTGATWTVGPASDRMGLRLQGPELPRDAAHPELVSLGIVWGALQVPPDGRPIALLADHQTVGGYPVPAVAIRADWPLLGQLAPGAVLRFARTDLATSQAAYRAQQVTLHQTAQAIMESDVWDAIYHQSS
jgi:allophanate hydrolase subunit 2